MQDAEETRSPSDEDPITEGIRTAMMDTMERLQDLRVRPVSGQWADELGDLRFRGLRLGHRLESLEHDGLLGVGLHRALSPVDVLVEATEEIAHECERRNIDISAEIAGSLPKVWLDREQLLEALRCAIDEALATIGTGGRIECAARATRDHVVITIRWSAEGEEHEDGDPLARALLARLTSQMEVAIATAATADSTAMTLRLPRRDLRRVRSERPQTAALPSRRWVFPTPTAA